jgi:uroporphyrinogen III methyltransferase/synthase
VPETDDVCGGIRRFREEGADFVTFTSSSTAENFHALGLPWPETCRTVSIGPVTSQTLRELGYRVDLEAPTHDIPGVLAALRAAVAEPSEKI